MNNRLAIDLYELTMGQVYFKHRKDCIATFDLFIRSSARNFYIACGIDEVLNYLENFKFTPEELDYLRNLRLFDDAFLEYLSNFSFKGNVWAVEEPEIVFPNEPILRITANLIEAQLVESFVLNRINLATTLATKAIRVIISAQGKGVYDFSLRRTQGIEASLACAKYSYMVGAKGTSNVLAGYLYKIPVVGTMAHSYVMSFSREIDSFLKFSKEFPTKSILLVDTYNVKEGIKSAIKIARFLKRRGISLMGIRLDSGDLVNDAKYARAILDREGFIDTMIFASGNLDEFKIKELLNKRAPIDAFGVGTKMGCSADLPYTDVIYKLVEIREKGGRFIPTMKLSQGKISYPGRKQIVRLFDKKDKMKEDILILEDEKIKEGKKILKKVMEKGRRLYPEKTLEQKRKLFFQKFSKLPDYLKDVSSTVNYPIKFSTKLNELKDKLAKRMKDRIQDLIVFVDIDTQVDFLNKKGALYVSDSEKIIGNLKILTNFARRNNILIVSTQDTHKKEDPEFKEFPPHCIKGTKGHKKIRETLLEKYKIISYRKIYDEFQLRKIIEKYPQIIIEKNVLSLASNPNTSLIFETIFPDKIYVYGVVVEYCVKEAIEFFLRRDYEVSIIEDAVKEISSKERDKLFSFWKKRGVEFIDTKSLINLLSKKS